MFKRFCMTLCIALLSVTAVQAGDSGKSATAEDCLKKFAKAVSAKDYKGIAKCFIKDFQSYFLNVGKFAIATDALKGAVESKFSKEAVAKLRLEKMARQGGDGPFVAGATGEVKDVKVEGNSATGYVVFKYKRNGKDRTKKEGFSLVNQDGNWLIDGPADKKKLPPGAIKAMSYMGEAFGGTATEIDKVTAAVKDGSLDSVDKVEAQLKEVQKKQRAAMMKVFKIMMEERKKQMNKDKGEKK